MEKILIASTRKSAGKTNIVVGLAKAMGKSCGYIKPLGDRLVYRKKRSWDYDAALVTHIIGSKDNPEDVTIGFEHSRLRYMYNETTVKEKLTGLADNASAGKDVLFIESGEDLMYGVSVNLDAISVARSLGAKLVLVVKGSDDSIIDDISFLKKHMELAKVDFRGVIINKVHDIDDFKSTYLKGITDLGVKVLGVIPYQPEFTYFSVEYLAEVLFAKVISGEKGLGATIKNIFVGAMSTNEAMRSPLFNRDSKLIVTSGDRSDMIISALDGNTSGILLTNNMLPPSNIISKAAEVGIPLMLVSEDIYNVARQIDAMEPLLTRDNAASVSLLEDLVKKNVSIKDI